MNTETELSTTPAETHEEWLASHMSRRRAELLSSSDWVTIRAMERGEPVPAEWAAYRQSLRNLDRHPNWPHLQPEDWPEAPGG